MRILSPVQCNALRADPQGPEWDEVMVRKGGARDGGPLGVFV